MIQTIGVFGAGTMGTNIAQEFAMKGFDVHLYSRKKETLDKSISIMKTGYNLLCEEGMLTKEEEEAALKRITCTQSIEECAKGCDWVLETIVENKEAKKELYEKLDEICPLDVIFTSDTSVLNIYEFMPERRLPNTLITHYFAPAHLMPLVELVKGEQTRPELVTEIKAIYDKMGKIAIVIEKVLPGFVVNRFQGILSREVYHLLDNNYISPEDLDLAVKSTIMFRGIILGLVQRFDFTGLDQTYNSGKTPMVTPPTDRKCLQDLLDKGYLGVKNGHGFYDYSDRTTEEVLAERDKSLIDVWRTTEKYIRGHI
ncbi:3-hydroxyacyl-CoA dehydrogenase family protein [Clostridia bacterium OttesenSCG-928-F22]|nr:3-hydroxyacyl-CoA dehydrogenase family protein [Clostridia bacterium OttesenSCG-928-F22]